MTDGSPVGSFIESGNDQKLSNCKPAEVFIHKSDCVLQNLALPFLHPSTFTLYIITTCKHLHVKNDRL